MERRIAAWLLIVTIFAVVFAIYPNNRSSILSKEVAYVISAAALSLVLGVAIARGVKLNERMGLPLVASFAALLAWMVIRHFTGLRSVYGPHTIYSLAALGMVGGTAGLLLDRKARTTVLWGLVAATGLLCIYTALQWMNVIMFPWDIYLSIAGRLSGSLGNPNLLGSFMASFIPVGVAFMLTRSFRPILRIALALLITAACVLCIVSSGTRGSMIGLVAGMGLMGLVLTLRQKSAGWKRFIPLGAAVAALLVVFSSMRTRFIELADPAHGTAQVRLVIWTGSLAMFEEKPIQGWGPGTFQVVFPRFRNPDYNLLGVSHNTEHAHSEYLEILTDNGLVGLLLFGLLAWQIVRAARRKDTDLLTLGLITGCVSLLAEAVVSVSLRWPPSAFLLTLYTGLLLSGAGQAGRKVSRLWIVPLAGVILYTVPVALPDYFSAMRSGHLLFVGKDMYLERIESDLTLAGNAAIAWEQTGDETRRTEALTRYADASVLCDSSVAWLRNCVRTNPSELGGWYGLGSAYLTRALIIQPTSQPLTRLLEQQGYTPDQQALLDVSMRALAAYESLAVRAPDYAELHNNFALAYTRLGLPAQAMHSMRRAYDLHAHRRADYVAQAGTIGPLGGWRDASHILWLYGLEKDETDPTDDARKAMRRDNRLYWFSGLMMATHPAAADSLASELLAMAGESGSPRLPEMAVALPAQAAATAEGWNLYERWTSGDTTGIRAEVDSALASTTVPLPMQYIVGSLAGLQDGDPGAIDSLVFFCSQLIYDGSLWAPDWPGGVSLLDTAMREVMDPDSEPASWRPRLLRIMDVALQYDSFLSKCVLIAESEFQRGVDPGVALRFRQMMERVGGPQAAGEGAASEPWIPGSIIGNAFGKLDSLVAADPGNAQLVGTRLSIEYEALSSFWWGIPRFTDRFRDQLLSRVAADRQALEEILGPEESRYLSESLMRQVNDQTETQIAREFSPFLERLRLDIVSGQVLTPVAP